MLGTLGAPERRLLSGRKGREVQQVDPEPVPTSRATVVRAEPFETAREAEDWLDSLRSDRERAAEELSAALRVLRRALHAHRIASADPHARDVSAAQALVVRIGYGPGDAAAEGRFEQAWELPRERTRTRRSMEAPEERFAALLGARESALACEELVLRARADLDAGRSREAALQARVALEALLAEAGEREPDAERAKLEDDRGPVGKAANAALLDDLPEDLERGVSEAVGRMEAALRRMRLRGGV